LKRQEPDYAASKGGDSPRALPFCQHRLISKKPISDAYPKKLNTLGDWIRKTRLDRGLTQERVDHLLGVVESCAPNWELGHTEPEIHYIPRIINFIGYCPYVPTANLVERLEAVMWALGLTRGELSGLVRTDESNFTKWLARMHCPSKKSLELIKAFLDSAAELNI
jgi:hypothetical protein